MVSSNNRGCCCSVHDTPMVQASKSGNYEKVKLLIETELHSREEFQQSIIMSIENGHENITEILIEYIML